jgi:hypothetical protein
MAPLAGQIRHRCVVGWGGVGGRGAGEGGGRWGRGGAGEGGWGRGAGAGGGVPRLSAYRRQTLSDCTVVSAPAAV